jgi:hypothetical protein
MIHSISGKGAVLALAATAVDARNRSVNQPGRAGNHPTALGVAVVASKPGGVSATPAAAVAKPGPD